MKKNEGSLPPGAPDLAATDAETGAAVLACFTALNKFHHDQAIEASRAAVDHVIDVRDLLLPSVSADDAARIEGYKVRCFPERNMFEHFAFRHGETGYQVVPLPPEVQ